MRRAKSRRLMGQMNVVPYIDVMLVLLIIFMVTAPLLQQGITVDLPEADAAVLDPDLLAENEPFVLSIDAAGEFYVNLGANPEDPVSEESVATTARAVLNRNPNTPMLVKADGSVPHRRVVTGYVALQRAGAKRIGVMTDPVDLEAP